MTEIPDLSALFGHGPQMELNPEAEKAAKALHDLMRAETFKAFGQVSFFAAVLCDCRPRYDRYDATAPAAGCVVHGHMQMDLDTGAIMIYGGNKWR